MREIKFRAKRLDFDEWVYGGYYSPKNNVVFIVKDDEIPHRVFKDAKPETVGQYTGFKDKNYLEIYEGDIIEFTTFDHNGADTQHIGVVYWCDGEFFVDGTQRGDDEEVFSLSWVFQDSELEVIGNIYENPDLLKGE